MPLLLRLQIAVEAETAKHLTVALNEISALVHKGEPRGVVERENRRAWFEVQRLSGLRLSAEQTNGAVVVVPAETVPDGLSPLPVPVPEMPESPLQAEEPREAAEVVDVSDGDGDAEPDDDEEEA
jgi:hypothetical protein